MIFDNYTKSIVGSYLTEAEDPKLKVGFPDNPKDKQVYVNPKNKKRYIYTGGSWRLWPQGYKTPSEMGALTSDQQSSPGYSPASTPEPPITTKDKPTDLPRSVGDIAPIVQMQTAYDISAKQEWERAKEEAKKSGKKIPKHPGIEYPGDDEEKAERLTVQMISGPNYKQGFDPYQQTAWVNIRQKAEEAMSKLDAGSSAKGLVSLVSPGLAQTLEPLFKTFGSAMLSGAKQIVRKNLAQMYLGVTPEFDTSDAKAGALWNAILELQPDIQEKLEGLSSSQRFGEFGNRIYGELDNLIAAGEDPFESALNITGAQKAKDLVSKQFTGGPTALETSAGYLETGRKQGIYK